MTANERLRTRADRHLHRALAEFGEHVFDARISAGVSREALGQLVRMSGTKIGRIEHARLNALSLRDATLLGAALGSDVAVRAYPVGEPVRDAGQARRLAGVLDHVGHP